MGIDIAKYHHEQQEGGGYPTDLSASVIPMSTRIIALVDVYEALRARQLHKEIHFLTKNPKISLSKAGEKYFDSQIAKEVRSYLY